MVPMLKGKLGGSSGLLTTGNVGVGELVAVGVGEGMRVGVNVGGEGVFVAVGVGVGDGVRVAVSVGVGEGVLVGKGVGVAVGEGVTVLVLVGMAVGVEVGWRRPRAEGGPSSTNRRGLPPMKQPLGSLQRAPGRVRTYCPLSAASGRVSPSLFTRIA